MLTHTIAKSISLSYIPIHRLIQLYIELNSQVGGGGEYLDPVIFGAYMALLLIHYVASMLGGGGETGCLGGYPPFPTPWYETLYLA